MPVVRVGHRRLYDAIGCSLGDRDELRVAFPVGADLHAEVYFGPRPRLGITVMQADKYIVPQAPSLALHTDYQRDASQSTYPRHFFTEILCLRWVEVTQELHRAFQAKEQGSHETLLRIAEQHGDLFRTTSDLLAGTIGLRFHRQFVIELINENFAAFRDDDDFAFGTVGPALELLEGISLNARGVALVTEVLPKVGGAPDRARKSAAAALGWLMRGWAERDLVSKFSALFITLELLLDDHTLGPQDDLRQGADDIRCLIREHGGPGRDRLLSFFNQLVERQRPSLQSRFELMARTAGMQGWEGDVAAFKRFNSMRNGLLHRGDRGVSLQVPVMDDVRQLEDLADRYASWTLFGDGVAYSSKWRRSHGPVEGDVRGQ